MSEKVLVDREQLERAASVIAWMSCRSDIKVADLKRLEQCASELSCALTAPAAPEDALSSDERVAALCDLSYRAGLKAGWNYCADGDETGFARSMESAREAVAVLNEHRQKGAPGAPVVQAEPAGYGLLGAISKKWDGRSFVPKDEAGGYDGDALLPLYTAPQPAEQQPAPDVAGLVEALELARRTLAMAAIEGEVTRRIDSALAAHRKQGGQQ